MGILLYLCIYVYFGFVPISCIRILEGILVGSPVAKEIFHIEILHILSPSYDLVTLQESNTPFHPPPRRVYAYVSTE